jgi:hypothetical protein
MANKDEHVSTTFEATKHNIRMNSQISSTPAAESNFGMSYKVSDAVCAGDLSRSRHDVLSLKKGCQCCSDEEDAVISLARNLSEFLLVRHRASMSRNGNINNSSQKTTNEASLLITTGARSLDDILDEVRNLDYNSWTCTDDSSFENNSVDSLQYYKQRANRTSVSKEPCTYHKC